MGPLDSTVSLNPIDSCMPFYPTGSRPRARQVIEKIKRQASALVRSPSRRARPHSCTSPLRVPTVTFVAASPVESSFSGRASSVPDSHHDNAILHIDAPPASDVVPYPIVSRLEYQTASPSAQASIPTPLSPPSPSASERSDSTSSIPSPVTPVFSAHHVVHPYASPAVTSKRWSVGSHEQDQSSEPFTRAKVQIVRRSLVQDHFLLACAAVDDPTPVEDNVHGTRSPKGKPSAFGKKSSASLPPSKPPPSCPLPSPPFGYSESSDSIHSVLDCPSVADQEWTLFLGVPSKPLEVLNIKAEPRKRAGSLPVPSHLPKQYLSPTDIPPQIQPRVRTFSGFSTCSHATGRRIESGPADTDGVAFDWTLSLPVIKKPKSSLDIPTSSGSPVRVNTRKCKSFTDWTVNLAAPHERQEIRLREKERKLERASHISIVSTASARPASHPSVKQLPTGPESTLPQIHPSHSVNAGPTNPVHSIIESMTSLHSATSSISSTRSSYKNSLPFNPCSPDIAPVSPSAPSFSNNSTYTDSLFIIPNARPSSLASMAASTPSIANFPLPPSFSHKLAQRRLAAPPMPGPLRSSGNFRSDHSFSVYTDHSHALTSAALPMVSSLSSVDFETHVATSAPATSLHFSSCLFPSGPSRSLEKGRPGLYYNRPTTSTSMDSQSSDATTISAASSKNSMKTASSVSTIVPKTRTLMLKMNIADVQTEHQVNCGPSSSLLRASAIAEEACYSDLTRPSFESSTVATEYYTCNEDGLSDEEVISLREQCSSVETDENSEHYHSARSSLDLRAADRCGNHL